MDKLEGFHQDWQKAWITDDFVFGNVMQMGNNCRDLLRAILPELHIQKVTFLETQKVIHDSEFSHGVRLDVYAKDEKQRIYDIEMQVEKIKSMGPRADYYQSKIEMDSLRSGQDYDHVKKSYVIFMMPRDFYRLGYRWYRFVWYEPDKEFELGSRGTVIVLNSKGYRLPVSPELQSFFSLMNGDNKVTTDFSKRILADIKAVKRSPAKEREFMDLAMLKYDARVAGEEKERLENATEIVQDFKNMGMSNQKIENHLSEIFKNKLTPSQIKEIIESTNQN